MEDVVRMQSENVSVERSRSGNARTAAILAEDGHFAASED